MRRIAAVTAVLAAFAHPGHAGPLTQDACPVAVSAPQVVRSFGSVLENLAFTNGELWISDSGAGAVHRLDPTFATAGSTPVASPGGIAPHAGRVYVGFGNSLYNAATRTPAAGVLSFDAAGGDRRTVATGMTMANGMVFDGAGNLYVSNDLDARLVRVRPDGTWTIWSDVYGSNGLVVDGADLYAAITFDGRSPIERIPLADPAARTTVAHLSWGFASLQPAVHADGDPSKPLLGVKGLDDMTMGPDGFLYVTANGTGELLRVHPATGTACLVAGGLQNPSSVRIAPAGGAFDDGDAGTIDLYITEFSGALRRVRVAA